MEREQEMEERKKIAHQQDELHRIVDGNGNDNNNNTTINWHENSIQSKLVHNRVTLYISIYSVFSKEQVHTSVRVRSIMCFWSNFPPYIIYFFSLLIFAAPDSVAVNFFCFFFSYSRRNNH